MSHSFTSSLFHCTFSTAGRRPTIHEESRERLWAYMGGIARRNNMKALAVGGVADHAHILLSLPAMMSISKAMQLIKGGSSKWVHDEFPQHQLFSWQEGYGAFSIGVAQEATTIEYIWNQETHHRKTTFQDEFILFLKKHRMEYDPVEIWK